MRRFVSNFLTIRAIVVCLFVLSTVFACRPTLAQEDVVLGGTIEDQSGAVVPNVQVKITNVDTGVTRQATTNQSGYFTAPGIPPGNYSVHLEHEGFAAVEVSGLVLHTADRKNIEVKLQVGKSSQTINVSGATTDSSPAVSMTVTREFVENMPLNGRSFQDLIQLTPGTVSSGNGYYSIDGQRTNSNNYSVDGVSANLGGYNNNSLSGVAGSGLSGSSPSQTALGTTQSLASIDSLQEFTIQTSGYAAEYGRNPGGQVQFTTRSGTDTIHGSLFDYLRNTALDANTFENNYFGDPKSAEHQNDFGGTLGGPVSIPHLYSGKGKTFYFVSYEGLRLLLPAFESEYVPTQALRNWAAPGVQPFLKASPLPQPNSPGNNDGCTVPDSETGAPTACDALFTYAYSYPNNLDNIALRVDHHFGSRYHAFLRYADTPSSEVTGAENGGTIAINTHSWTFGVTANISRNWLDDFHFNYSHDGEETVETLRSINDSIPWPRNLLIPPAYDSAYSYGQFGLSVAGTSLSAGSTVGGGGSVQHQYQLTDGMTWTHGSHTLKFGGDWRRLTPTYSVEPYYSIIVLESLAAVQQGFATLALISATAPGQPVFDNLSLYIQDHWKPAPHLSFDYGVRWEYNPPPRPSNGNYPLALTSSSLPDAQLAPQGTNPYKTTYDSFAPRIGFAWNAIQSRQPVTIRGGFGIFFDTGQTPAAEAYAAQYPFKASRPIQSNLPMPLSMAALAPPSLNAPLTPPYSQLYLSDPGLTLPYTEQWNLSLDEKPNANNTVTLSYVGNAGRRLLFSQYYYSIPDNQDFTDFYFTSNASHSSYNALQVQDVGRLAHNLDVVASFTWAHALDNASNDLSEYAPTYGNSDYDLRKILNVALNYQTSAVPWRQRFQAIIRGWLLANRFSTQGGYPLNIAASSFVQPDGSITDSFPDLIHGVPIYLHGRAADVNGESVPGSWRLNQAAFASVPTDPTTGLPARQGSLGRNYVRGPSFYALNSALQRSFPIHDALRVNFRAEAFNVLNHPNIGGYIDTFLPDSTFGQALYGEVQSIGSTNQLYSMGASRSLQVSLHLQF
jgi:hypothetical protein